MTSYSLAEVNKPHCMLDSTVKPRLSDSCRAQPQQQHDLLEQTLAEEMSKAQRRSGTASNLPPGIQFKQVHTYTHTQHVQVKLTMLGSACFSHPSTRVAGLVMDASCGGSMQ